MGNGESLATAVSADVTRDVLRIELSDGRVIETRLDRVPWLRWLRDASEESHARWSLEPGAFAVYWEDLDDGVEVRHPLALSPLA